MLTQLWKTRPSGWGETRWSKVSWLRNVTSLNSDQEIEPQRLQYYCDISWLHWTNYWITICRFLFKIQGMSENTHSFSFKRNKKNPRDHFRSRGFKLSRWLSKNVESHADSTKWKHLRTDFCNDATFVNPPSKILQKRITNHEAFFSTFETGSYQEPSRSQIWGEMVKAIINHWLRSVNVEICNSSDEQLSCKMF